MSAGEYDRIADMLIADYAVDLPKQVADRAFGLAWQHGHSGGASEIEHYFVDFADLAGDAYRAGLRSRPNANVEVAS